MEKYWTMKYCSLWAKATSKVNTEGRQFCGGAEKGHIKNTTVSLALHLFSRRPASMGCILVKEQVTLKCASLFCITSCSCKLKSLIFSKLLKLQCFFECQTSGGLMEFQFAPHRDTNNYEAKLLANVTCRWNCDFGTTLSNDVSKTFLELCHRRP